MKRNVFLLSLLGVIIMLAGCKKDKSTIPPVTAAELRIFNSTPWSFYNCTIDPAGTLSDNPTVNAYDFGQVDINIKTSYHRFAKLYRYSWVRLTMNSKTYYLKPYDYTGETVLESGKYTYKLTYTSANDQLGLELTRD